MHGREQSVTVVISALPEQRLTVACEPEGMTYDLEPGEGLRLTFTGPAPQVVEVNPASDGLVIVGRPPDSVATITASDGQTLTW